MAGIVGTHRCGYRDLKGTQATACVAVPIKVEFAEKSFVHEKRFGTDKWVLCVGDTLDRLLTDATSKARQKPSWRLVIKDLEVVDFRRGLFQWSKHLVRVQFSYALCDEKKVLQEGTICEDGVGSGSELGFMTYVPILGNINHNKAVELALSRCLQACLRSLIGKITEKHKSELA